MKSNMLTIDTEDWFQVFYGGHAITRENWNSIEPKISQMISSVLELLENKNTHATFFVVGWIAERNPLLIRKIVESGHEIASHSYWHTEVFRQSPKEFREDIKRAKECLEQASGLAVKGFRAPGYSIRPSDEWALDIIIDVGHKYDSSLLYIQKPFSEILPGFYEVAPNSISMLGVWLPSNGGFFFRIMPYLLYKYYVKYLNRKSIPLVFYTHTWEVFIDYPQIPMPLHKKIIQYTNLTSVKNKIEHLVQDFEFTSIEKHYPIL